MKTLNPVTLMGRIVLTTQMSAISITPNTPACLRDATWLSLLRGVYERWHIGAATWPFTPAITGVRANILRVRKVTELVAPVEIGRQRVKTIHLRKGSLVRAIASTVANSLIPPQLGIYCFNIARKRCL